MRNGIVVTVISSLVLALFFYFLIILGWI
jgi:hypothetical protein